MRRASWKRICAAGTPPGLRRSPVRRSRRSRNLRGLIGERKRAYFRLGYGFSRSRNGAANMHAASCIPAVTGAWQYEGGGAFHSNADIYGSGQKRHRGTRRARSTRYECSISRALAPSSPATAKRCREADRSARCSSRIPIRFQSARTRRRSSADSPARSPTWSPRWPRPRAASPAPPTEFALSAVYYDTADLRLLRSRLTLRRRRGGNDAGWHLKLPAGADSRDEVRLPLGRARKPPGAAGRAEPGRPPRRRAAARRRARHGPPRVDADRRRGRRRRDRHRRPGHRPHPRRRVRRAARAWTPTRCEWAEIEVELAEHGTPEVLDRIEEALAARRACTGRGRRRSWAASSPTGSPPPRRGRSPGRTRRAGEVVLAYLAEQADAIRATDPQVRRDAPEGVHDMRVACRRMRSALQSFRALLDRTGTDDLVAELRWLAGELGGARDLEVQEERIAADVAALPPELALGPVAAQTTRFFATRRAAAAAHGHRRARRRPLPRPARRRRRAARRPAADRRRRGPGPRPCCPALIAKAVRRVRKAYRAAHAHPPGARARRASCTRCARPPSGCATPPRSRDPRSGARRSGWSRRSRRRRSCWASTRTPSSPAACCASWARRPLTEGGNGFAFGWLLRDEQARAERVESDLDAAWKALRRRAVAVTG